MIKKKADNIIWNKHWYKDLKVQIFKYNILKSEILYIFEVLLFKI